MSPTTKVLAIGTILIITGMIAVIPHVMSELVLFAQLALVTLAVLMLLSVVMYGLLAHEKLLTLKAQRMEQQHKAMAQMYQSYTDGFGMVHLLNLKTNTVENLSTYPGSHHNGTWADPPEQALLAWHALVARNKAVTEQAVGQLVIEQPQVDLLDLIDQYPHTLVWGGTGGGKTSLLRLIARRRKNQGHDVVVLDTCEHPIKWEGLLRMETIPKIESVIRSAFSIHQKNKLALASGQALEEEFRQITIISDEWTSLVRSCEIAPKFIEEMVRETRKYGLHCVFSVQTNLASDLGLDGRWKTINGFLQLELKKLPDGQHIAVATVGANKKLGEYSVPEPPPVPYLLPTGYEAPGLEIKEEKPSPEESRVLKMLRAGASYRQISKEVWKGGVGSWYNNKIDRIAQKWGVSSESE